MRLRRRAEIKFITKEPKVAAMFPPVPAIHLAPDWWKKSTVYMPERRFPNLRLRHDLTIKGCPGIGDYLGLGYVIPMWADLLIKATDEGFAWELSDKTEVGRFVPRQWELFPRHGGHEYALKIEMPWRLHTPRGWSVLALPPWYQRETRWSVLPGVVDSDRLATINFIALWHGPKEQPELIRAGTPLVHVVPFRRSVLPMTVVPSVTAWEEINGWGMDAVDGARLAPGAYRETGRREPADRG